MRTDSSIRQIGPMAQDFYAAFGMGHDDKRISTIDTDGVALAAIQGLHAIVKEKDAEITDLRAEKDVQISDLTLRLERMEAAMSRLIADQKRDVR